MRQTSLRLLPIAFALLAAACGPSTVKNTQFTVTLSFSGSGSGTVSSASFSSPCTATCAVTVDSGTTLVLDATPNTGSTFDGWGGACSGTGSCTLTVTANMSVAANFGLQGGTVPLTVAAGGTGSGTVTSTDGAINCGSGGSACSASYSIGSTVTLTATADVTSAFTGWGGACSGTGACVVTMTEAKSVTATFAAQTVTYAVNVSKIGTGTGTVTSSPAAIDCGSTCTANFTSGSTVTLTAAAAPGSAFSGWSGDCAAAGASTTCTLSVTRAANVTAQFDTLQTFALAVTVTATGTASGSVTSTPTGIDCTNTGGTCTATYSANTSVTLTAAPGAGSVFSGWGGACPGTGTTCVVSMTQIQNVTAAFAPASYAVNVTVAGTGAGSVTDGTAAIACGNGGAQCSANYASGSTVTLTATAGASSFFVGWTGDCQAAGTSPTCTFTVAQTVNVTATFDLNPTPLQVVSTTPADGATGVAANTSISIAFNMAVNPNTITADATTACTQSVQVSADNFQTCVPMGAGAVDQTGAIVTFQPTSPLTGGATYFIRVTTAATSNTGTPLAATYTSAAGFTVVLPPPQDVTNLQVSSVALQTATLTWTPPNDPSATINVLYRYTGGTSYTFVASYPWNSTGSAPIAMLPYVSYDFLVQTISPGGQSNGVGVTGVVGAFTTTTADWPASLNQTLKGLNGDNFRFTWNSTELVVDTDSASSFVQGDVFLVAIDTDPAADVNGANITTTIGSNDIIWPFKADLLLIGTVGANNTLSVQLQNVDTNTVVPLTDPSVAGTSILEMSASKAELGNPTAVRLAFASYRGIDGLVYDVAPKNPNATDVSGFFASLTASMDVENNLWNTDVWNNSAGAPMASAPNLVTLQEVYPDTTTQVVGINGNLHPLSTTPANSSYTLFYDATAKVYSGIFNFGGVQGELDFQFVSSSTGPGPEFAPGIDHVYTLSGLTEQVPLLTFGAFYSASNPMTITFHVSGGAPLTVEGSALELGNWSAPGYVPPRGPALAVQPDGTYAVTVTFNQNENFLAAPLQFKAYYGPGPTNFEGGNNHVMDDDVINTRVLNWNAGDSSIF